MITTQFDLKYWTQYMYSHVQRPLMVLGKIYVCDNYNEKHVCTNNNRANSTQWYNNK